MRLLAALLLAFGPLLAAETPDLVVRPGHPRLLADAARFAELRRLTAADPAYGAMRAEVKQQAEKILGEKPSKYEIPDGLRLLATSRRVLERMNTLGMAWQLEGDRRYVDRAWTELQAAAAFPDWNPRHFLDTAEMTRAFATAYDWMYDAWTPAQREELVRAIVDKGLTPGLKVYAGTSKYHKWHLAVNNWNQVCNAGLAIGALAVADVRPEESRQVLRAALASLPRSLAGYAPDGAWNEGYSYFHYAATYTTVLLASLESATGGDAGLGATPGLDKAAEFPVYLGGPAGRIFAFSDGGEKTAAMPEVSWLARRHRLPVAAAWQARNVREGRVHPLDLLWTDPHATAPAAGLARYFRGSNEFMTMRTAWEDPLAGFVGFKGGDNNGGHWHHDAGTFTYDVLGERWATDLGPDNYNLRGYFGKARGDYYRLRAEGHNTLVINPDKTTGQELEAKPRFTKTMTDPARMGGVVDLTPAYAGSASSVLRGVRLLPDGALVIRDEIALKAPANVLWFMHTYANVKVTIRPETPGEALLEQNGRKVRVRVLSPTGAKLEECPASPLPTSPNPAGQNENGGYKKLRISLSSKDKEVITVVILPQKSGLPDATPAVTPLSEW